jgi:predicted RND superfamily exporter protein
MGFIQRRLRQAVIHVVANPKTTLLISAILLVGSIVLAFTRLGISSDENKLFSDKVKFFKQFLEFDDKFPENDALYVVVEAKDTSKSIAVPRWVNVADRITEKLRTLPKAVSAVDSHVPSEQMGPQGILFDDAANVHRSFNDFKNFTDLIQLWGEKPASVTAFFTGSAPIERFLAGMNVYLSTQKPDEQVVPFVALLAESWVETLKKPYGGMRIGHELPDFASLDADDPSRLGYYYVADESDRTKHLLLVRVYPNVDYTSLTAISETVETIRAAIREVGRDFPEFTLGTTGRPALGADEMSITDRDSKWAEIVALSIVFVVMAIMLKSIWLALVAEISLGVGIGWTFGWATLTVGELNLLSLVFLIALIGIGMDYLVQILAAYRREARRRLRAQAIWTRVFKSVSPPINTACMGAAGAFLVSALTDFRGAADLGIIAGGGLLLCLLSGYTVLPALLVLFPPKLSQLDASERYTGALASVAGWRRMIPAAWIIALIAGVPFALRTHFNPNLLDLQAPNLPSVKLIKKLQTWSAVVLSKDLSKLREVRKAVEQSPTVAGTESILNAYDNYDWFKEHHHELQPIRWAEPTAVKAADLSKIGEKAAILSAHLPPTTQTSTTQPMNALRKFANTLTITPEPDDVAKRLTAWQTAFVQQLRELVAQMDPPPVDVSKIPKELRSHFVSDQGDYALYILPKADLWQRKTLEPFVQDIDARIGGVSGELSATGIAPNIYHSTSSIEKAFYQATAYALGLIFILVMIDLRNLKLTLMAMSVLALGLPMLVSIMGLLGIDWNFANFFGLPILIGAGHEYGVFLVHRYLEASRDPRRSWRRWDASDRALLLCAFITSSSFGFFWILGHHRGLKSLGLVMALGTACIYLAAVLVLRPILLWKLRTAK